MPKIAEFYISKATQQSGYSRCGIQAVIKKFEETGEVKDDKRTGRPKTLLKSDESFFFERPEEVQQGPGSASGSFIRKFTLLQSKEA